MINSVTLSQNEMGSALVGLNILISNFFKLSLTFQNPINNNIIVTKVDFY